MIYADNDYVISQNVFLPMCPNKYKISSSYVTHLVIYLLYYIIVTNRPDNYTGSYIPTGLKTDKTNQ